MNDNNTNPSALSSIGITAEKVRRLQIVANRRVNNLLSGQYKSVFRGRGMEFDEVRQYQPGDDIRDIDWNVTARYGEPFIKRYCEERELTIMFLVDVSASGIFGSADKSKLDAMMEIASVLMFSALKNNDKIGMITFADDVIEYLPPRKGKSYALSMIQKLVTIKPVRRQTNLSAALEFMTKVLKRRSVVFLISDLDGDLSQRALMVANRRHDLVALRVNDPREYEIPNVGFITLEDPETGELIELDTHSAKVRALFSRNAKKRDEQIDERLRRSKVDQLKLNTQSDSVDELRKFFEMRERRIRH